MTFPIGLVVMISLLVSPLLGDISPPSPILYLYLNGLYRGSDIYSPNSAVSALKPVPMNYGTGLAGWHLENISFVSGGLAGGAMIVNKSQLYTYGIASLAGIGVNSTDMILPTLAKDFYPETIVNVRSTYTSGLVLLSNGSTYSWGSGNLPRYLDGVPGIGPILGQPFNVELGDYPLESLTVQPTATHPPFKAIYSGVAFSWSAIDFNGSFYTFGFNQYHTVSERSDVNFVPVPENHFATIAPIEGKSINYVGGLYRSIAFMDDGSWLCWGIVTGGNACGQESNAANPSPNPMRFYNPYSNITFTKILSSDARMTYALANDSTLWAWGSATMVGATISPYCSTSWCYIHQVPLPPGRENVKIIDIWGSFSNFFIMNEIGEIYDSGTPGSRVGAVPWELISFVVPNGHQIDFSRSDSIGIYGGYLWLTKLVEPCPEPRPYFGGNDINCVNRKWRIFNPIISSNLSLSGPVQSYSNLTITFASTMVVNNYSNLNDPVVTMPGCIEGLNLLQILFNLSDAQLESESSEIPPLLLFEFDSGCQYGSLPTTSVIQRNPRISAFSNVSMTTNGTRSRYVVSFTKSLSDYGLGSDLTIGSDSQLDVPGDMIIDSPVTIKVPYSGDRTIPALSIGGCIKGMELLTLEISLTEEDLDSGKIDPKTVIEINSTCTIGLLPAVTISQPKLCKKAQAEIVVKPLETRLQMSVLFKISKVSCNTWWIILLSVICGLAAIAVGVTLLIFLNPRLRMKCQPYVNTRQ